MEAFEAPRKGWDHVGPIFIHPYSQKLAVSSNQMNSNNKGCWTKYTAVGGCQQFSQRRNSYAMHFALWISWPICWGIRLPSHLIESVLFYLDLLFSTLKSTVHFSCIIKTESWSMAQYSNCVLKVIVLRCYVILPRPRLTWIRVETLTFFWFHHVKVFWIFLNHVVASNLHERHTLQEASFSRYLRTVYVAHFERVTRWWSHGYCRMLHLEDPRFAKHGP